MPIKFGKAKELTVGGESIFELDSSNKSFALNKHESMAERGFDLRVDQAAQNETPQAVQTNQNINQTWPLSFPLASSRRISKITFRAFTGFPITDGVLIVRRGGQRFYVKFLGAISDISDTEFDLTTAGMVPIDLFDMTAYTMSIVSQSGMAINLAGNPSDEPFYKWEFHDLISEDLAYNSDLNPVVKGGIEGIEFDEAMSLHPGGDSTFQTDHVIEKISALVMHPVEDERAADRFMDVASRLDNEPVFIILADTLTNPSFPFQVGDDARLLDVQVMSAGAQTNVMFKVFDQSSGKLVWSSMIGAIPSSGTVKIDFTDTTESNVPIDIFNSRVYTFDFSSEDGDVLLLGNNIPDPDQPWLTASFIPFFDESIAYLADLVSSDGTFHVDINTTVPLADRDGTVFRPYKNMTEALGDVGTPDADNPHTFIVSAGDYAETFNLGPFNHILNTNLDPASVQFVEIIITVPGRSSVTRCLFKLNFDTVFFGGATKARLTLNNCAFTSSPVIVGRGAGSDEIFINGLEQSDSILAVNVRIEFTNITNNAFNNNLNFSSSISANPDSDGQDCVASFSNVFVPNASTSSLNATFGNLTIIARNSVLPNYGIIGANSTIQRDANTVIPFFPAPDEPTIVNLDISKQVAYDNTASGLAAVEVKSAIDEINVIAQLYGSCTIKGSADVNPVVMSREGPNLYDVTAAEFMFIDKSDPQNHIRIVKQYPGETGRTLALTEIQRNVFMYMDVGPSVPMIVESLRAPELELNDINDLVSIGNFDLIEDVVPFDTIQVGGVNTFVHAAYAESQLSNMLHLTRGNFNIQGSIFSPNGANLFLDISSGRGLRLGVNIQNDSQNPDVISDLVGVINNVNMQWVDNAGATNTQFQGFQGPIDTTVRFDPLTDALVNLPSNRTQVMYLYKFYGSNSIRAHFGDIEYLSHAAALAAVRISGPAIPSDQTLEAQLRGALVVDGQATELDDTNVATFVPFA